MALQIQSVASLGKLSSIEHAYVCIVSAAVPVRSACTLCSWITRVEVPVLLWRQRFLYQVLKDGLPSPFAGMMTFAN